MDCVQRSLVVFAPTWLHRGSAQCDDVLDYFVLLLLIAGAQKTRCRQAQIACQDLRGSCFLDGPACLTAVQSPGLLRRKKRSVTVLDLIKTCPLNISIAHPSLRDICDRYEFAEGIVALVQSEVHQRTRFLGPHRQADAIVCLSEANTEGTGDTLRQVTV